jgi:hypothetical protein
MIMAMARPYAAFVRPIAAVPNCRRGNRQRSGVTCVATVNLPPQLAKAAVDAALAGDAAALSDATGHAVNATARVGIHNVQLFLETLAAPPIAILQTFGTDAALVASLSALLMVQPLIALMRWPRPETRQETEGPRQLPLLCLIAADVLALSRIFVFNPAA